MKQTLFKILAVHFFLLTFSAVSAQSTTLSPVGQQLQERRSSEEFVEIDLFSKGKTPAESDRHREHVASFEYLVVSNEEIERLLEEKPDLVRIELPGSGRETLELYRVNIFASGYSVKTSSGLTQSSRRMAFYHGQLGGNSNSLAAISVFEDEVTIMYANKFGTHRVQKTDLSNYIHFKDTDILNPDSYECFTSEEHDLTGSSDRIKQEFRSTGSCVEIYFECDYESYQDNGSDIGNTEEWVAALFNEVSILYENENVPISISSILVWDEEDPYINLNSTSALLNEFVSQTQSNGYDGRLAHLLTTRGVGGGIAYINVLCSTSVPCAVSGSLSTNIVPFPTYSWNVTVVAHELGHNFGSRHTHGCVWNGNNTQIDDCGNEWANNSGNNPEGSSCYDENDPILPESGGTVMSYCHLISGIGINFNNGFGPQPGDLLYENYSTANCETGDCFAPECTSLTSPQDGATDVDISAGIAWVNIPAASAYKVTMGTSSGGTDLADDLDVGGVTSYDPGDLPFNTEIFVTITPYNAQGDAEDCVEESFTTENDGHPACTQLAVPADGATDVDIESDLTWSHAVGNQQGYLLTIGYTPGGGEITDQLDVGNVNTYDPGSLPNDTIIYVLVTPYNAIGSPGGCIETSFTTEEGLVGDDCSGAASISCGTTVFGSTLDATNDDVSSCGTSISAAGIWYRFTGDGSNVSLSMCSATNYDSKISVYSGSCAQLSCVAGNDDLPGCNYASGVDFLSNDGAEYFILVHGWNGQIGSFALTMACADPPTCPSQAIIADDEWISDFSISSFNNSSGKSIYSDFTNMMIEVDADGIYPISLTPDFVDGPFNEYFRVWADFNEDGDFEDTNELLFEDGPVTGTSSGNVSIPSDVLPGEYLMRVSMRYNGFPDACDVFTYGEVEEYTLKVRCNTVVNSDDSGPGSVRAALDCISSGDTVFFSSALDNSVIELESILTISKDAHIFAFESQNIELSAPLVNRTIRINAGRTVGISGIDLRAGTNENGGAILNYGDLTLENVQAFQHDGYTGNTLVRNHGALTLKGTCEIHDP